MKKNGTQPFSGGYGSDLQVDREQRKGRRVRDNISKRVASPFPKDCACNKGILLQKCQKSAIIEALAYLDILGYFIITVMILSDTEIIMTIINTLDIYEDLKSQFKEEEARTLTKALEKSLEVIYIPYRSGCNNY